MDIYLIPKQIIIFWYFFLVFCNSSEQKEFELIYEKNLTFVFQLKADTIISTNILFQIINFTLSFAVVCVRRDRNK